MLWKASGETLSGVVAAFFAVTAPFGFCSGAPETVRDFSVPASQVVSEKGTSACVAIPDCGDFKVTFRTDGKTLDARLVETARIREQRIALYRILSAVGADDRIDISLSAADVAGGMCADTGPLTGVCNRTILGYGSAPSPFSAGPPGTFARCDNLSECRDAKPDILMVTGRSLFGDTYVDSLAALWATRLGLNTAIVDVSSISLYSPVAIRDFIKALYNSSTAEHFGDGRLGFVVLLGDAFEDDNVTPMVPDYDGYGGNASASDHFYACISGTDDFEDVMIGRIPSGTADELRNYYLKLSAYSPLPSQPWTRSWLFAGGCYFAQKQDYVAYFDSLEIYVPDDIQVSRYYRYDFPNTSAGDNQACQAMIDSLDSGKLFLLYSGDGDKWDWGARFERAFRSDLIDDLANAGRLPIVLSISCSNGWFDNTTEAYKDGGYDCFAERLLNQPGQGAIACLASSREAGGSASTVFAPEIVKSAYVNGSSFLGELIMEAKTRHLARLGQVMLVRQFNLFGDPCLNFVLHDAPITAPDLVIRPYSVSMGNDFPLPDKPLEIDFEIWNASGSPVDHFSVSLYSGHPDSGGAVIDTRTCKDFCGWEKRELSFVVDNLEAGRHHFSIVADAGDEVVELDETNNFVSADTYVYPFQCGYPIKMDDDIRGEVIGDLDGNGSLDILAVSAGSYAAALSYDGSFLWVKNDLGLDQVFAGVEPSAFDLNGDGATEAVLTTKSSLLVAEGATGNTIWQRYTEYPALSPMVVDLDGDGTFEIVMGTYDYMFTRIYAFTSAGATMWTHQFYTYKEKITGLLACDADLDGYREVIVGTDKGDMICLDCASVPPTVRWDEHICDAPISCVAGGDLDRDGSTEVVAAGSTWVYVLDALDGAVKDEIPVPCRVDRIAIGNLDADMNLEIVCTSSSRRIFAIDGGAISLDVVPDFTPVGSPVLADIDQDGASELIVAMAEGRMRIIKPSGQNYIAPVPMRGLCLSGPVSQDLDGDGNVEILAGSSDSLLFVLDLGVPGGRVDWLCSGGTSARSGLYAQPVFGTVGTDLTLSGRIDVVGDVLVESTGTLTLERGADVRFVCDSASPLGTSTGKCEVLVEGSLVTEGGPTAPVRLASISCPCGRDDWMGVLLENGSYATMTGTQISGAVTGIECKTSQAYISECTIADCTVGLKVTAASPLIDHNVIRSNNYGISANQASATIVGNQVTGNLYAGVILSTSSNAFLEDNLIGYTTQGHGISCYSSSPSIMHGNDIRNNTQCGIYMSNSSPMVDSCWIGFNGDCGLKAAYYSNPVVSKTTIAENRIGVAVYVYANPVLGDEDLMLGGNNDIRQNSQYALYNATANTIKAQMTWWGCDPPDPGAFVGPLDYSGWLSLPPAGIEGDGGDATFAVEIRPNPFSSRIMMAVSAPRNGVPVELSLYDVRGRLVRRFPSVTAPGLTQVVWDGRDEAGDQVASGTYYLSVRSRSATRTSKILLLR